MRPECCICRESCGEFEEAWFEFGGLQDICPNCATGREFTEYFGGFHTISGGALMVDKKNKTKLIGIQELSERLGVSRQLLYWHMDKGLPVARKAVKWGFRIEDVEEYFRVFRGKPNE